MKYSKDLTESFRLRLSKKDMDFLIELSEINCLSVSEVVRCIIQYYRKVVIENESI